MQNYNTNFVRNTIRQHFDVARHFATNVKISNIAHHLKVGFSRSY